MKEIKSLTIIGKRWFQKSYGNTYHTVKVIINNSETLVSKETYGYENHYKQTAFELLQQHGYFTECKDFFDFSNVVNHSDNVTFEVIDVKREKDLKFSEEC